MCFSPQASFLAGITLTMIGLACMKKVYQANRRELLPLAATPLLFGVQQLLEGALWLGLLATPRQETLYAVGLYGFLWIALFWWPWWIPYVIARCEQKKTLKRILYGLSLAGFALGVILFWPSLSAELIGGHIAYTTHGSMQLSALYLLFSIVPFFITSTPLLWLPGILIFIGLIVSTIAYYTWVGSVWCFFAALISASVYLITRRLIKR